MRYHLFQQFFEKVVKIKETLFLLSKCLVSIARHCKTEKTGGARRCELMLSFIEFRIIVLAPNNERIEFKVFWFKFL